MEAQIELLTVADTGAGPNMNRADLLPDETILNLDTSRDMVGLSGPSNHRIEFMGIATLSITISKYKARQKFLVVKRLGADVILGCTFIDVHINAIRPRQIFIQLRNESTKLSELRSFLGLCNVYRHFASTLSGVAAALNTLMMQ